MNNSNKQNMNNFGHKLPTFEQAAWAVDGRAIINHYMPEAHTNIQVIEEADLASGSQSEWFNMCSDIAIDDEQSIRDFFTYLEYSEPSLSIPGTDHRATESNFGYLSPKLLPSTFVPDDQLLRGTRSAPIIIPDSPDRDNLPDHGERYQSCHKRKRAREPEIEAEIMFSNPPDNMKKAKKLHDSQNRNESLPSIQREIESNKFVTGWDGVQYVNGRMLIPLGRDMFLEELLSTTTVHENMPDSQEDFFSGLPDSTLQYVTRCTIPPSLRPRTSVRHKGFIEIF